MDSLQSPPILRTKLYRPRQPGDIVVRGRLMDTLERVLHVPLTVVIAPAGYGKTTLVSSWVQTSDAPHAWLSLDEHDDQLDTFVNYMVAAIESVEPDAFRDVKALTNSLGSRSVNELANVFINDVDALEGPFVLVLDDFQSVRDPTILDFLSRILAYPPRPFHLILISRIDPLLPLQKMRSRGQMAEIRARDLAFSLEETTRFLQQNVREDSTEISPEHLRDLTEGWVTGLRLAVLSHRFVDGANEIYPPSPLAVDYLMNEVINEQPPHMQEWLFKTSIVGRLNSELCATLCATDPDKLPDAAGQDIFHEILSANLFVSILDIERAWIRYHDLFLRSLRAELARRYEPKEINELHRRAADWFAQHRLVDEAIYHAIAAGESRMAIALVANERHTLIDREQWRTLERRLRLFSREEVNRRAELLIIEAWIANVHGRWEAMQQAIDRIEALLAENPLPSSITDPIRGEIQLLHANLLGWTYDGAQLMGHVEQAIQLLPQHWGYARAAAHMLQAYAYLLTDRQRSAEASLLRNLREPSFGQLAHHRSLLLFGITGAYWWSLDIQEMEIWARHYLAHGEKHNLPETTSVASYYLGSIAYFRNDLEMAEKYFAVGASTSNVAAIHFQVQAVCGLALTYLAQGRLAEAEKFIQEQQDLNLGRGGEVALGWLRSCRAEMALAGGHMANAQHLVHSSRTPELIGLQMLYLPQLTWVKVLLAQEKEDTTDRVMALLAQLEETARHIGLRSALLSILPYQAFAHDQSGDRALALMKLREAVQMAEPIGFVRVFLDLGLPISGLLRQLAEEGSAAAFIDRLIEMLPEPRPATHAADSRLVMESLTARELDVLDLLAERLTNQEIAQRLFVTEGTVKQHTHNIYQKLAVNSRREAVHRAGLLGIITPN